MGLASFAASLLAWDVPRAGEVSAVPPPAQPARPLADPRPPVLIAVETDEPVVALSFDDGPDPRWTPALLDALHGAQARATFFVTGSQVRAHPDLVQRMAAEGHEVANHTDTHPRLEGLDDATVTRELTDAAAAIAAVGAPASPWFRPPLGRYDATTVDAADRVGLRTVGWTVCFERWLRRSPDSGVAETAARVHPGGIIVAHDGGPPDRAATVAALPVLLQRLRSDGYRVATVGELLGLGEPVYGRPGDVVGKRMVVRVGAGSSFQ